MPFYDYQCPNCKNEITDIWESMNNTNEHRCSKCNSNMKRKIYGFQAIHFKDLPKGHNLSATKRREYWNSNDPKKFKELM